METAKRNIHILYNRHIQPLVRRLSLTSVTTAATDTTESTLANDTPSDNNPQDQQQQPPTTKMTHTLPTSSLALPLNSLILVTGANGYIATNIIYELLLLGYRVRGTVRSADKGEALKPIFSSNPNYSYVVVSDLTDGHAWDRACEGVDGIIHLATIVSFSGDPDQVIPPTVAGATNILSSAVKAGTVKRFVYTSSSTAALNPVLNTELTVTSETWNEESEKKAYAAHPGPYPADNAFYAYGASKTAAERAVWKFTEEEKPGFVVNTVLPNANIGRVLNPPPGITGSFAIDVLHGDGKYTAMFPPQWFVDVIDDARVHIAALIDEDVKGERLFAFAKEFNWGDMVDAVRKVRPEAKGLLEKKEGEGRDLSLVPENVRAERLLGKWWGQEGWKDLEESVRENLAGVE
jgi:nucleoside-diphosphate-sugar epimerase